MAPADAMWYWFASKFPTDQYLVFAFDGQPASVEDAVAEVLGRARTSHRLGVRIADDPLHLRFPRWAPCDVLAEQAVVHTLSEPTWTAVLAAVAGLIGEQLDPRVTAWRLHVFTPVFDVPGCATPATVAVLQIAHAMGDGPRTAALAGHLFGRLAVPPEPLRDGRGDVLRAVLLARRAGSQRARDVVAGVLPPPKPPVPALSTNDSPEGPRTLRTLVRQVSQLPGPTPTIGALMAVSDALSGYLRDRGEDTSQLTAAVPVARSGVAHAYNHVDSAVVGLYPDIASRDQRIHRIASDLVDARRRSQHPAAVADDRVFEAVPAVLRRLGVWRLDTGRRPMLVPANTVVSSVDRGQADLSFGGCPVLFTAGYPALLPILTLAHGVHRLGDSVTISVHAATGSMSDADEYVDRLDAALRA